MATTVKSRVDTPKNTQRHLAERESMTEIVPCDLTGVNELKASHAKIDRAESHSAVNQRGLKNGRFVEPKNQLFLVDVMVEIRRREHGSHLLFVGDGPLRSVVEKKVARRIPPMGRGTG